MNTRYASTVISVFLLICAAAGCMRPGNRVYVNPNTNFRFVKKVAVLPFQNLSQDRFADKKVWDTFVTTLLASEAVEVLELGEVLRVMNTLGITSAASDQTSFAPQDQKPAGTITRDAARDLGQALGIQGIILGSVEEYGIVRSSSGSYPEVSLTLRMVDPKTGSIIWAVSHTEKGSRVLPSILGIGEDTLSETALKAARHIVDTLVYE
ncbi:MAG: hypothetical protein ACMUIL_07205 [bacterium]